jgi:hypothetical protein
MATTVVRARVVRHAPRGVSVQFLLLSKVDWTQPEDLVLPVRVRAGNVSLALFTTITILGTPIDITLQELRAEAFHPADQATAEFLSKAVASPARSI